MEKKEIFKLQNYKKILISNYGTLFDLSFTKNNEQVICSGNDHEISFWDLKTYQKVLNLKGHTNTVTTFQQCQQNEKLFISTSSDKSVKIWKIKDLSDEQIKENTKNKKDQENYDIIIDIQNPDGKTTIGAAFITEDIVVFGQCYNKAYFYSIKEKKIIHEYVFNNGQQQDIKQENGEDILKLISNIKISENNSKIINLMGTENTTKQSDQLKPKQSWVTQLHFDKNLNVVILCENSKIHFIDPTNFKTLKIVENTHEGHILSLKIFKDLLLLGSSDSYGYLYEIQQNQKNQQFSLELKLKVKAFTSACANIDFYLENGEINSNQGGIIISAFDPIVKFVNLKGELIFQVENVASPMIWDSQSNTLVGRDYNITRELVIQQFEKL